MSFTDTRGRAPWERLPRAGLRGDALRVRVIISANCTPLCVHV